MTNCVQTSDVSNSKAIRELNDRFRTTFSGGRLIISVGVSALGQEAVTELLHLISSFNCFGPDNDPYAEHDFGRVEYQDEHFFWKIDYYDESMRYGSEDPTNPAKTTRVLTIMFAGEY